MTLQGHHDRTSGARFWLLAALCALALACRPDKATAPAPTRAVAVAPKPTPAPAEAAPAVDEAAAISGAVAVDDGAAAPAPAHASADSPGTLQAANDTASNDTADEDDEDDDAHDYWKNITFDVHNFNEVPFGYTDEQAIAEAERCLQCKKPYCVEGCPVNIDIPGFVRLIAEGKTEKTVITPEQVNKFLGPAPFIREDELQRDEVGVATGLAWTSVGGEILYVETATARGKGGIVLTGQLGDVMKESAQIALSLARATSGAQSGVPPFDYSQYDLHIHVPAGGIPKDGPSAGVTIVSAISSLLRQQTIDPLLGMTGEITLRGAVLPVGGIKEKLIAAHRAGLKTILLPARNASDLEEVPPKILEALRIEFISTIDDLFAAVFPTPPQKMEQKEVA